MEGCRGWEGVELRRFSPVPPHAVGVAHLVMKKLPHAIMWVCFLFVNAGVQEQPSLQLHTQADSLEHTPWCGAYVRSMGVQRGVRISYAATMRVQKGSEEAEAEGRIGG